VKQRQEYTKTDREHPIQALLAIGKWLKIYLKGSEGDGEGI